MKNYKLEVNEEQLLLILSGLEALSRAGTGQFMYALEELSHTFKMLPWKDKRYIDKIIKNIVYPELTENASFGIASNKTEERSRKAYDIFQVIRKAHFDANKKIHNKLSVWGNKPIPVTQDKLITCEEI